MTSVWPALWPPWKRTTTSACSDSQSTILLLPSSPHWAPTTTTFAIVKPSSSASEAGEHAALRARLAARQGVEAPRAGAGEDEIEKEQYRMAASPPFSTGKGPRGACAIQ